MAEDIPGDLDLMIGDNGLRHRQGRVAEEWHRDLRGKNGIKTYRQMRDNSPVIGASMFILKSIITNLDWPVRRADDATDKDAAERAGQYLESIIEDMDHAWSDFIDGAVEAGLPFGFAPHEIVLKIRGGDSDDPRFRSRFDDRRVGVRKLALRPPHTLERWEISETGDILGMHQFNPTTGRRVFLPIGKLLLLRTTAVNNSPEGRSLLRNAYRPWYYSTNIEEIEAIGIERELCGLPHFEVPPHMMSESASAEDKQRIANVKQQGQDIRNDERGCIVTPAYEYSTTQGINVKTGWNFSLVKSGGKRAMDTDAVIRRHEHRQAMSVMTELLLLGSSSVGTESLATTKMKMLGMAVGGIVDTLILGPFNNVLVPMIMRMNPDIPRDAWPVLGRGDVVAPSLEEVGQFLKYTVPHGVIVPDDKLEGAVRDLANLPDREVSEVSRGDFKLGRDDDEVDG